MTEPRGSAQPDPEPPRPPDMPDLDVDVPADEGGDGEPGNVPADDDVEPDAGTMEPPD